MVVQGAVEPVEDGDPLRQRDGAVASGVDERDQDLVLELQRVELPR
jgi:hypothetical protein